MCTECHTIIYITIMSGDVLAAITEHAALQRGSDLDDIDLTSLFYPFEKCLDCDDVFEEIRTKDK